MYRTPITRLSEGLNNNSFFAKREDLIPFSFGGNKARKAEEFKKDIIRQGADTIITYGSSESNHCRVIANLAKSLNMDCFIVSPLENYKKTFNTELIKMCGAKIINVPLEDISRTIDEIMNDVSKSYKPYFIPGGGHGNLGTKAYVDCFNEINEYEKENNIYFDYVFLASGTGTTQAGLVCGQIIKGDLDKKIIGISIARKCERGEKIISDSIKEYLRQDFDKKLLIFDDSYILGGYGVTNEAIFGIIKRVYTSNGIALNPTYTGKAYYGMLDYISKGEIFNKNILFINTGGTPLFFDKIERIIK